MKTILVEGEGINLKTGKMVRFKVPDTISKAGVEKFLKNIELISDNIRPSDQDTAGHRQSGVFRIASEVDPEDVSEQD